MVHLPLNFTIHGQPFNAAMDLGGNSPWVPFPGTSGRGGTVPGAFPGISPQVTVPSQQGASAVAPLGQASQIPLNRNYVKNVFPASSVFGGHYVMTGSDLTDPTQRVRWAQTPFRIAMNAGDLLSRQSAPGGSNQVKGAVGPGQTRYTRGARPSEGGGVWPGDGASGNQHWVYDSSDYIRYKKMSAVNKNYNDIGFGGAGLSGVGVGQSMFKIAGRNNPDGKRNSSYPIDLLRSKLAALLEYFREHFPDHLLAFAGGSVSSSRLAMMKALDLRDTSFVSRFPSHIRGHVAVLHRHNGAGHIPILISKDTAYVTKETYLGLPVYLKSGPVALQDDGQWAIKQVVIDYFSSPSMQSTIESEVGPMGDWDTSHVTDMSFLFKPVVTFGVQDSWDEQLQRWDVSNVTTFESMFAGANAFTNKGVSMDLWDLTKGKATSMKNMFAADGPQLSRFGLQDICWAIPPLCDTDGMFMFAGSGAAPIPPAIFAPAPCIKSDCLAAGTSCSGISGGVNICCS